MPTLPSLSFSFTSKAGEHIEWRSTVSVNSEGIFHLTFPAELVEVARVELKAARTSPFDPMTIAQPRTQWQVQGPKLDQCKLFLERVAQAYLRTETTVDRVIMYHVGSELSYFRLANGTIVPHAGRLSEAEQQSGKWQGSSPSVVLDHYRLGLFAQVLDRITEHRGDHVAVRYARPQLPDGSWGAQLNSWTHLNTPAFRLPEMTWPVVPYTETAAEFFFRILFRLCQIADQLQTVLADPTSVATALESAGRPALPSILWSPENESEE